MKQITIKDIASKLGLSVSTVSRALNDHPDIHADTKKIVNETAVSLGYRPNIVARSLKSSQSNQIGVIVPEIRHDFFANAISGIEEVAYQNGYTVIVSQSNEDINREKINLNSMFLNRVAGIIVSISQTTNTSEHFAQLLKHDVKMVFFDRVCEDLDVYCVEVDDQASAYNAVKYLIDKGYKKIVHLAGAPNLIICRNRSTGYENALMDHGLASEINVIKGGMHEQDGYDSMDKLIKEGNIPDAIFAVNDPVAIGAFKRLKEEHIKIPDQVGIIGFSNNPITEMVDPPLTTVEQPSFEMGKTAAKILLDQIEGKVIGLNSKIIRLETKLIIRNSA
ncbi:MAG: LacI family DNA-binding transcriptional regulator [Ignavibacteriaceae bacterium]